MRVGVVGAGAIGGWIGARLDRAGEEVSLLARGAHLDAIRADGLRLIDGDERSTHRLAASDDPGQLGPQDVVLVTLKYVDIEATLRAIEPMVGPDTVVVTAMNGLPWWFPHHLDGPLAGATLESVDPGGRLSARFDDDRLLGLMVMASATVAAPGVVHHTALNRFALGEVTGPVRPRTQALAEAFTGAGLQTEATAQIRERVWYKLFGNANNNPVSFLALASTQQLLEFEPTRRVAAGVMGELLATAKAIGLDLDVDIEDRIESSRSFGHIRSSMLQDLDAGRPIEVEAIVGAPLEVADLVGVDAPHLRTLYGLTRLRDLNRRPGYPGA